MKARIYSNIPVGVVYACISNTNVEKINVGPQLHIHDFYHDVFDDVHSYTGTPVEAAAFIGAG